MPLTLIDQWKYYVIGYFVFVVFPNLPINWVIGDMWFNITKSNYDKKSSNVNLSARIGIIERTLYVGSILYGKPEFIGIWLVLKVAGRFWKDENERKANDADQQAIFQVFLIGSGLSIAYAVIGARSIQYFLSGDSSSAYFFGASLIPLTLILRYYPKLSKS